MGFLESPGIPRHKHKFASGDEVEVFEICEGFEGTWANGKIIKQDVNSYEIEYSDFVQDTGTRRGQLIRELFVDERRLRPRPPWIAGYQPNIGDSVEMFWKDLWWVVSVDSVQKNSSEKKFVVHDHQKGGEAYIVTAQQLRPIWAWDGREWTALTSVDHKRWKKGAAVLSTEQTSWTDAMVDENTTDNVRPKTPSSEEVAEKRKVPDDSACADLEAQLTAEQSDQQSKRPRQTSADLSPAATTCPGSPASTSGTTHMGDLFLNSDPEDDTVAVVPNPSSVPNLSSIPNPASIPNLSSAPSRSRNAVDDIPANKDRGGLRGGGSGRYSDVGINSTPEYTSGWVRDLPFGNLTANTSSSDIPSTAAHATSTLSVQVITTDSAVTLIKDTPGGSPEPAVGVQAATTLSVQDVPPTTTDSTVELLKDTPGGSPEPAVGVQAATTLSVQVITTDSAVTLIKDKPGGSPEPAVVVQAATTLSVQDVPPTTTDSTVELIKDTPTGSPVPTVVVQAATTLSVQDVTSTTTDSTVKLLKHTPSGSPEPAGVVQAATTLSGQVFHPTTPDSTVELKDTPGGSPEPAVVVQAATTLSVQVILPTTTDSTLTLNEDKPGSSPVPAVLPPPALFEEELARQRLIREEDSARQQLKIDEEAARQRFKLEELRRMLGGRLRKPSNRIVGLSGRPEDDTTTGRATPLPQSAAAVTKRRRTKPQRQDHQSDGEIRERARVTSRPSTRQRLEGRVLRRRTVESKLRYCEESDKDSITDDNSSESDDDDQSLRHMRKRGQRPRNRLSEGEAILRGRTLKQGDVSRGSIARDRARPIDGRTRENTRRSKGNSRTQSDDQYSNSPERKEKRAKAIGSTARDRPRPIDGRNRENTRRSRGNSPTQSDEEYSISPERNEKSAKWTETMSGSDGAMDGGTDPHGAAQSAGQHFSSADPQETLPKAMDRLSSGYSAMAMDRVSSGFSAMACGTDTLPAMTVPVTVNNYVAWSVEQHTNPVERPGNVPKAPKASDTRGTTHLVGQRTTSAACTSNVLKANAPVVSGNGGAGQSAAQRTKSAECTGNVPKAPVVSDTRGATHSVGQHTSSAAPCKGNVLKANAPVVSGTGGAGQSAAQRATSAEFKRHIPKASELVMSGSNGSAQSAGQHSTSGRTTGQHHLASRKERLLQTMDHSFPRATEYAFKRLRPHVKRNSTDDEADT